MTHLRTQRFLQTALACSALLLAGCISSRHLDTVREETKLMQGYDEEYRQAENALDSLRRQPASTDRDTEIARQEARRDVNHQLYIDAKEKADAAVAAQAEEAQQAHGRDNASDPQPMPR
jgi:hypothetical protein